MRVLEVQQPPDGGLAEHVRLLTEGFVDMGVDMHVAGPPNTVSRQSLVATGARFYPLPEIVPDMLAPALDAATFRRLAGMVIRGRYDIVHAHGLKAGLLVRMVAPAVRVPVVYTPHSLQHHHHLVRTGRKTPQYRKTLWMERVLGRATRFMINVSEHERRDALADRLIRADRAVAIHNGVQVDPRQAPDPELLAFRQQGPLLGYIGGLRDEKGLPVVLDALELLAGRGQPVRFAIVGNGPLADTVRARVDAGPLSGTTLLAPFRGRVEPYLRALDAYVLASPWEGLPLGVLEAMMLGVPPVATAVGGVPEAVSDGRTGLLIPPNDAEALAHALARVASDPSLRERLGDAARRDAIARFGADRMVQETLAVYERCRP